MDPQLKMVVSQVSRVRKTLRAVCCTQRLEELQLKTCAKKFLFVTGKMFVRVLLLPYLSTQQRPPQQLQLQPPPQLQQPRQFALDATVLRKYPWILMWTLSTHSLHQGECGVSFQIFLELNCFLNQVSKQIFKWSWLQVDLHCKYP